MKSILHSEHKRERKSIKLHLAIFFIFSLIMIGCSTAPTFIKSDYDQKQIKSIAIMPVIDKRNIDEDTVQVKESISNIEELLLKKIIDKHYDVVSPSTVKNLIKEKEIQDLSPKNLSAILNVDGILFSELYDYSDKFFVNHSIKMRFSIYDAQGDSLWINELEDSDKPFLSAIGASLGWAIGVAVDNKISSKNKLPTIIAGVAAAQLIYVVVDGLSDETSQSIDGAFKSLPDAKSTMR
jgi:hypothetical protein